MGAISIEEFEARVAEFPWRGNITEFHVHHTGDRAASWRGAASVESIRRYHVEKRNYRDAAQHVLLGPDGTIWLCRDWNLAPASATGHNGWDFSQRPFMVEVFGDFRTDKLEGVQRRALVRMIAAVQEKFSLPATAIKFHKELQATECPGDIDKEELVKEVQAYRFGTAGARSGMGIWQRFKSWFGV